MGQKDSREDSNKLIDITDKAQKLKEFAGIGKM